jgi:hypothetical protein
MGILSEQSQPFFGKRTSFSEAYSNVESAVVRFVESDACNEYPPNACNLISSGPRISCKNDRCNRGGYDFEQMLGFMVSQGEETKDFQMPCNGDEGSPKGRKPGKECLMSIEGSIKVKYKENVARHDELLF